MPGMKKSTKPGTETGKNIGPIINNIKNKREIISDKDVIADKIIEVNEIPDDDINVADPDVLYEDEIIHETHWDPFEAESPCFPFTAEITVDLDTLKVETEYPDLLNELSLSNIARARIEAIEEIAKELQNVLEDFHEKGENIDDKLLEKDFLPRPDIGEEHWKPLKDALTIAFYKNGKLIKEKLLKDIARKRGRPREEERHKLLRELIQEYLNSDIKSLRGFARNVWEEREDVREIWRNTFESFRKDLNRKLENERKDAVIRLLQEFKTSHHENIEEIARKIWDENEIIRKYWKNRKKLFDKFIAKLYKDIKEGKS